MSKSDFTPLLKFQPPEDFKILKYGYDEEEEYCEDEQESLKTFLKNIEMFLPKNNNVRFDQWLYKACEHIQSETKRNITDIYSSINLTDAKLQFLDGVQPKDFNY